MRRFDRARAIALALPLLLLAGALGSQYFGGLYPCEMCHWQRWPHYIAILLAALAFAVPQKPLGRALVALAITAILISGAIGVFHAGVEYRWWEGFTQCSILATSAASDTLAQIMATPLVRCDEAQWRFLGISLAGYNALFSLGGAAAILWLCLKPRPR